MIITIREYLLKGRFFKIVVWIFLIIMLILWTFIPKGARKGSQGTWVAEVNGHEIGYNDFSRKVADQKAQIQMLRQKLGKYADLLFQVQGMPNPNALAIEALVREELINEVARKLPVNIHDDYIRAKLMDFRFVTQELSDLVPMHVLDQSSGINMAKLDSYLRSYHLSMSDFQHKLEQAILRDFCMKLVEGSLYTPEFAIREAYGVEHSAKSFSILTFSYDSFLKQVQAQEISQQDLQAYFKDKSSGQRYWIPEKRSGTVWKFDPYAYGIQVTNEDIQEYYDENKAGKYVEQPARVEVRTIVFSTKGADERAVYEKAKAVREELSLMPSTFGAKAQAISDDKESAKRQGLIPAFSRGAYEPDFDRAAFLLKKDGDISDVIQTNKGFEILQRVSRTKQAYKPLESVKKEIVDAVTKKKFAEQFARDIKNVVGTKDVDVQVLQEFVHAKGAQETSVKSLEKDASSKLAQELFAIKANELSSYLEDGVGMLVKVTGIEKRHLPTLDSIRGQVVADMQEERAAKKLEARLKQAKNMASEKPLKDIAQELGATFQETEMINPSDASKMALLKDKGLPVEQVLQMEKQGQVGIFKGERNGYLVQVDKVEAIDEKAFQAAKKEFAAKLEQERGFAVTKGFVDSLNRTATIKLNESLLNT